MYGYKILSDSIALQNKRNEVGLANDVSDSRPWIIRPRPMQNRCCRVKIPVKVCSKFWHGKERFSIP